MNRLILLALLLLLVAFVSSSRVHTNNDPHKKRNEESLSFVSREKRNMYRDRAYQRANMLTKNAATRRRRNKGDDHALRAEADALAAAEESVAAGDNAVNAAIEIEEERKTVEHKQGANKNSHEQGGSSNAHEQGGSSNDHEQGGSVNEHEQGGSVNDHEQGGSVNEHEQSGSKSDHDSDAEQEGSMEEGHGQDDSKDEHEESNGSNDEDQQDTDDQENEIVEQETVHEKTKSSHMHKSTGEDSESEGQSSNDSEESKETAAISKSSENGVDTNKLMSQSSELAQQIKMVFDIMSKREKFLIDEMKKLQSSLAEAIKVLKSDGTSEGPKDDSTVSRNRREFHSEEPYRACVYIESAVDNIEKDHGHHRVKRNIGEENPHNQGNVQVRPDVLKMEGGHPDSSENVVEGQQTNTAAQGSKKEGIDLSAVYWFKLPEEQNLESVHDKIQKIFTGISDTDRDVLIIPVTKSFTSKQEVANAFLNVFRTKRSTNRQKRDALGKTLSISQM